MLIEQDMNSKKLEIDFIQTIFRVHHRRCFEVTRQRIHGNVRTFYRCRNLVKKILPYGFQTDD